MLWQRILYGSMMIAALVGLFWFDAWAGEHGGLVHHGTVITAVWAVVAIFATMELGALLRAGGHSPAVAWAILINISFALLPLAESDAGMRDWLPVSSTPMLLLIGAAGSGVLVAARRRTDGATQYIAVTLLMIVYIGLLGSYIPRFAVESGSGWLLLEVLLIIKSSDIGAYFIGRAIGRHKLIEWLSPKKTWEGFFGGMAVAALVAMLVAMIWNPPPPRMPLLNSVYLKWALFGALMGVAGQLGDLFESLIKRDLKVKDSGAVVPAFGGFLDILDSPLVCVPIAYGLLLY